MESRDCFNHLYLLDKRHGVSEFHVGSWFVEHHQYEKAASHYEIAVETDPLFVASHLNLASCLQRLGQDAAALQVYERALQTIPKQNTRNILVAQARLLLKIGSEEAIHEAVQLALQAFPTDPELRLLAAKADKEDCHKSIEHLKIAHAYAPDSFEVTTTLAWCYCELFDHQACIQGYENAMALQRSKAHRNEHESLATLSNLVWLYVMTASWTHFYEGLAELEDGLMNALDSGMGPPTQPLFLLTYPFSDALLLQVTRSYVHTKVSAALSIHGDSIEAAGHEPSEQARFSVGSSLRRRLRVGYVSSDFGEHAVGKCVVSLFRFHNKDLVETFAYFIGDAAKSNMSRYFQEVQSRSDHFVDLSMLSDREAAELIVSHSMEILVNLNGHTINARDGIFALRPAPVQVQYLGYQAPYGHYSIPSIVADRVARPPSFAVDPSERVIYMPHSFLIYEAFNTSNERLDKTTPDVHMPMPAGPLMCNFGKYYKIDPTAGTVWANILRRLPSASLWLLRYPKDGADLAATNLDLHMLHCGVFSTASRGQSQGRSPLVFTPLLPDDTHLQIKSRCDLYLDTFWYGSHTTLAEALWAGVSSLAIPGERMSSRVGASLVHSATEVAAAEAVPMGSSKKHVVARSWKEYEDVAVRRMRRAGAGAGAEAEAKAKAPFYDNEQYVRDLETAYQMAYEARQQVSNIIVSTTP